MKSNGQSYISLTARLVKRHVFKNGGSIILGRPQIRLRPKPSEFWTVLSLLHTVYTKVGVSIFFDKTSTRPHGRRAAAHP